MPRFSVVIPLYNRADLIGKAIESVLQQTIDDFEVIVIDDGSTDNSKEIVRSISDGRVTYHYKNNEERSAARNTGIEIASGRYVSFLDSDDFLYPHHLETANDVIEKYGEPPVFHLGYEIRDRSNNLVNRIDWLPERANDAIISGNHLSCNAIFLRRDVAVDNLFNRDLTAHEDYDLWLRLASKHPLICDNRITSVILAHANRSLITSPPEELIRNISIFEQSLFDDPDFLNAYGHAVKTIKSNNRVHIALHLALTKQHRLRAISYLLKALRVSPNALRNRAFYGALKRLFI